MGRFECCTTEHEKLAILIASITPCPEITLGYSYNSHKIHLHQYVFIIFLVFEFGEGVLNNNELS